MIRISKHHLFDAKTCMTLNIQYWANFKKTLKRESRETVVETTNNAVNRLTLVIIQPFSRLFKLPTPKRGAARPSSQAHDTQTHGHTPAINFPMVFSQKFVWFRVDPIPHDDTERQDRALGSSVTRQEYRVEENFGGHTISAGWHLANAKTSTSLSTVPLRNAKYSRVLPSPSREEQARKEGSRALRVAREGGGERSFKHS